MRVDEEDFDNRSNISDFPDNFSSVSFGIRVEKDKVTQQ